MLATAVAGLQLFSVSGGGSETYGARRTVYYQDSACRLESFREYEYTAKSIEADGSSKEGAIASTQICGVVSSQHSHHAPAYAEKCPRDKHGQRKVSTAQTTPKVNTFFFLIVAVDDFRPDNRVPCFTSSATCDTTKPSGCDFHGQAVAISRLHHETSHANPCNLACSPIMKYLRDDEVAG